MTRKAGGNATLTLTQSVVGNVIGPFLSLLLVHGYMSISVWYPDVMPRSTGGFGELLERVFTQFGLTLFLPLVSCRNSCSSRMVSAQLTHAKSQAAGQVVRSFSPEAVKKIMHDYQVIKLASLSLLVMIWSGYDSAFASHAFADTNEVQLLSVVIICASLFVVWMLVSVAVSITFLGRSDTVAVAFCIPTKSPALGIPLATILFAGCSEEVMAKVYIPLIIFQLIQTCLSNVATLPFRHWKTKTDSQTESNAREL